MNFSTAYRTRALIADGRAPALVRACYELGYRVRDMGAHDRPRWRVMRGAVECLAFDDPDDLARWLRAPHDE